jgi:hypothetical protein
MADLIVSAQLDESAKNTAMILDELQHPKSDDSALDDIYGQGDLKSAMHDFDGDWKIHREGITKNVSKLNDMLSNSMQEWASIQQQLTDGLQTNTSEEHH